MRLHLSPESRVEVEQTCLGGRHIGGGWCLNGAWGSSKLSGQAAGTIPMKCGP